MNARNPGDIARLIELHPLPWRIADDAQFSEDLPLTILDARGGAVGAIAGFGIPGDETDDRTWLVARTLIAVVNAIAAQLGYRAVATPNQGDAS